MVMDEVQTVRGTLTGQLQYIPVLLNTTPVAIEKHGLDIRLNKRYADILWAGYGGGDIV